MATVHTPVEGFTGRVVGVDFVDGVADTDDDSALNYFRSAGYTVDDGKKKAKGKAD